MPECIGQRMRAQRIKEDKQRLKGAIDKKIKDGKTK